MVKDITGRDPESFETIGRRVLADVAAYERQQYFRQLMHGMNYAQENADWQELYEN